MAMKFTGFLSAVSEPKNYHLTGAQRFSNHELKEMITPLLIEQFLSLVVGLMDTLMVSYAGEATVSGVSLDAMIYTIFNALFGAIATGGAVVVSQYIGYGDRQNSDRCASQMFHLSAVISLLFTAVMLAGGNSLLRLLYPTVEPEVMSAARIYLRIVICSFPANALYNAGAAMYRAIGRTDVTMKVSFLMNLLNIAGNAVGIFVLHAGAAGVAWPTTIAWYFAAVVMTTLCFKPGNRVCARVKYLFLPEGKMVKRILRVAIPNATENTLFQLAKVVLGTLVASFGTAQIAANGIGQTLWSLAALVSISMGNIFITVIGQCMGAGDENAAEYYMVKLTRLSLVLCLIWSLTVLALTPLILPLYNISEEAKRYVFISVLIHNGFMIFFHVFSFPLSSGLRAAGDVQFTMVSSIVSTFIFRTLMSFILGLWLGWGLTGVCLAMALDWCLKAYLDLHRFFSGKWKGKKII